MNKRLRKKKHLKEFIEYGFEIKFRFDFKNISERGKHIWGDLFISYIENLGFQMGGGWDSSGKGRGIVSVAPIRSPLSRRWKYPPTLQQDKEKFDQEMKDSIFFLEYQSSGLFDINHDSVSWAGMYE